MSEQARFTGELGRRLATIDGQLNGIERLLKKGDTPQALTQSAAVRHALESLVRIMLQASITGRFAVVPVGEAPEDIFERALDRAMTHWVSSEGRHTQPTKVSPDEADFQVAARQRTHAIQDRLREIGFVLEGDNYLHALPELGAMIREADELMGLAQRQFIKERAADGKGSKQTRAAFEQTVAQVFKYWHLPDPRVPIPVAGDTGRKILVVDDDPDVVDYLTYILHKHEYCVVTASSAEEAMQKVIEEMPDLIILDIMMPSGIEGFHFAWNLRGHPEPECRCIPIIVLSAIHDTTSLRFYPEQSDGYYGPGEYLPVDAFIDKPVQEEELLRQVVRVLGRTARNR